MPATRRAEVGVRELRNDLSRYIDRARAGEEVIVTDRGQPVARLTSLDPSDHLADHLAELVAAELVRPPARARRHRPRPRATTGSVSDLVAEQRR